MFGVNRSTEGSLQQFFFPKHTSTFNPPLSYLADFLPCSDLLHCGCKLQKRNTLSWFISPFCFCFVLFLSGTQGAPLQRQAGPPACSPQLQFTPSSPCQHLGSLPAASRCQIFSVSQQPTILAPSLPPGVPSPCRLFKPVPSSLQRTLPVLLTDWFSQRPEPFLSGHLLLQVWLFF